MIFLRGPPRKEAEVVRTTENLSISETHSRGWKIRESKPEMDDVIKMDGWIDRWKCPSARGKEKNDANTRAPSKPSAIFFLFSPFHFFFFFFLTSSLFLTCERSFYLPSTILTR